MNFKLACKAAKQRVLKGGALWGGYQACGAGLRRTIAWGCFVSPHIFFS